jgi:DNA polymerase III delta prime subunit
MNISFFDDKPNLDELDFKINIFNNIKKETFNIYEMINMIFYGVPSSGKSTKIYAFLASILDKKVYDLKTIEYEDNRKIMIYKSSIYHIEINPITLGSNEKLFIQSFLKSYVQTKNIGLDIPKIIVIKNADQLSTFSKMALRKIIEKTSSTAKFIFEVSNLSKLPEPILSRFLLIRIKMPNIEEIKICINNFSKRKNIIISNEKINQIINDTLFISSKPNLKKIFGFYRYYISTKEDFKFLYFNYFNEIYQLINNKKISFVSFQKIRDLVYEMYINLVPMNELLYFLYNKFIQQFKNKPKELEKFYEITTKVDNNITKGNKECIHLEYYIISIIDIIQNM